MEGIYEVWKYEVPPSPPRMFSLEMQAGARILSAQIQHGSLCLWALCDIKAAKEQREILIVGTGQAIVVARPISLESGEKLEEVPGARVINDLAFIGTVQLMGGDIILHVFEMLGHRPRPRLRSTAAPERAAFVASPPSWPRPA